jgi:mRNA deadenylase 3'-5' endonuclease subunit Ccr4
MEQPKITIATYNVLADAYIRPEYYPGVDTRHLASPDRYERVVERIAGLGADVVCLQEADHALYVLVERRLRSLGYHGRWAHKDMGKPDGCAMFVGPGCRHADWRVHVYDDAFIDGKPSGHIALMTDIRRNGLEVRVATTHFKWMPSDEVPERHVGFVQAKRLVDALSDGADARHGTIVCGDFNAQPDSPMLSMFAESGYVDPHAATTATFMAEGRPQKLDYLLYHGAGLRVQAHPAPDIRAVSPLPSQGEPSDHLPLVTTFFVEP